MEVNSKHYPGFCNDEERSTLAMIIEKSLKLKKVNNEQSKHYWYPLSIPTYGSDEVLNLLDSLLHLETSMGRKVRDFEAKFANWVGSKHAIMVNSGSTADLLACFVSITPGIDKLKRGDEVLIPALTWPTQIWSACMAGFRVKLIDIDPKTYNTTPMIIEKAIGPKTKAIFLVHLLGNPCDMDGIMKLCRKHNLLLLEDCCESLGARYAGQHVGTFGLVGAFSFFFSHHLVTMEGGMVITNDDKVADTLRVLRAHGWSREIQEKPQPKPGQDTRFQFVNWGFNVRPTELQGAFGQVQLSRLDHFLSSRSETFETLKRFLRTVPQLCLPETVNDGQPSWMFLPIRVKVNDKFTKCQLVAYLEENGVETRPVVVGDLKRQPAAAHFNFLRQDDHSGTEHVDEYAFLIGLHPDVNFNSNSTRNNDMARMQKIFEAFICFHCKAE